MEIVKKIPPGAVRVHLGSADTCWTPRGSMQKNSLGADLLERLESHLCCWTNPEYGDSLKAPEAADMILHGMKQEVEAAIDAFLAKYPPVCARCRSQLVEGQKGIILHCSGWECDG